jgi:hypothetical protein
MTWRLGGRPLFGFAFNNTGGPAGGMGAADLWDMGSSSCWTGLVGQQTAVSCSGSTVITEPARVSF